MPQEPQPTTTTHNKAQPHILHTTRRTQSTQTPQQTTTQQHITTHSLHPASNRNAQPHTHTRAFTPKMRTPKKFE